MTGFQVDTGDHQSALRRKAEAGAPADGSAPVHPLLTLQSQIGNAQVARLLAQREATNQELEAKHDLAIQRDGDDLAQAEHEQVGIEGGPVGPDTTQRIHSARGTGSTLDASTRASMESGFGTSFEDVRVHHDSESDVLNRRLTSHAFTTGSDIFLRSDASPSDSRLMAHELTHVVQQRSMSGGGSMTVGAADDSHEHHADAMAETVLSQSAAPGQAAPPAAAQRAVDDEDKDTVEAKHDLAAQRAVDNDDKDTVEAKHDLAAQRAVDDDDKDTVEARHDLSLQREAVTEDDIP